MTDNTANCTTIKPGQTYTTCDQPTVVYDYKDPRRERTQIQMSYERFIERLEAYAEDDSIEYSHNAESGDNA